MNSAVFIGDGSLVLGSGGGGVWLARKDGEAHSVVSGYEDIRFLSASPYGEYFAFWSITGESFRLFDLTGEEMWSEWMNADKALALGTWFASSGDAVACAYEFEGAPGLFFCDIGKGQSTIFGCAGSPIGYDSSLHFFAVNWCDPLEDEKLPFFRWDADSGKPVKLSPDVIKRAIEKHPIILDRDRVVTSAPFINDRNWDAMALRGDLYDLNDVFYIVYLKGGDLHWSIRHPPSRYYYVENVYAKFLSDEEKARWRRPAISLLGIDALIYSDYCGEAKVFRIYEGLLWQGTGCLSVILRWFHVIAVYKDGSVGITWLHTPPNDPCQELKFEPPPGFTTVAADFINWRLTIAYMSRYGGKLRIDIHVVP